MNLRSLVPVTALAVACLGISAGTAHSEPATAPVEYETTVEGGSVVTILEGGSFEVTTDGKWVTVEDAAGNAITNLPLSLPFDGVSYPLEQKISEGGTKLSLTPVGLPVKPVATVEENDMARRAFDKLAYSPQTQIGAGIGGTLGALTGGLLGAVAGCLVGLPFAAIGCPIGAAIAGVGLGVAGGFAGAFTGAAIGGGQPLYTAFTDMYETLIGAPWTSKFYENPNNGLALIWPVPVGP